MTPRSSVTPVSLPRGRIGNAAGGDGARQPSGWHVGADFSSDIPFRFQANVVGANTLGNGTFSVSPTRPATKPGVPFDVTGTWSGVDTTVPATAYVAYPDGTGTLVDISG
jgi:hypothetical protein